MYQFKINVFISINLCQPLDVLHVVSSTLLHFNLFSWEIWTRADWTSVVCLPANGWLGHFENKKVWTGVEEPVRRGEVDRALGYSAMGRGLPWSKFLTTQPCSSFDHHQIFYLVH